MFRIVLAAEHRFLLMKWRRDKNVKERSAIVKFKAKGEDAYFLAWTTTPWTLPSNTALCVSPTDTYCKVKAADGCTYYLAEALLDTVLGKLASDDKPAYEILETRLRERFGIQRDMSRSMPVRERLPRSRTQKSLLL